MFIHSDIFQILRKIQLRKVTPMKTILTFLKTGCLPLLAQESSTTSRRFGIILIQYVTVVFKFSLFIYLLQVFSPNDSVISADGTVVATLVETDWYIWAFGSPLHNDPAVFDNFIVSIL
jgi:hypothetical protein